MVLKLFKDRIRNNAKKKVKSTVRRRTPEIPSKVGNTPDPRLARKRKKELNKTKAIKRQIANNRKMATKMQGSGRRSSLRSRK